MLYNLEESLPVIDYQRNSRLVAQHPQTRSLFYNLAGPSTSSDITPDWMNSPLRHRCVFWCMFCFQFQGRWSPGSRHTGSRSESCLFARVCIGAADLPMHDHHRIPRCPSPCSTLGRRQLCEHRDSGLSLQLPTPTLIEKHFASVSTRSNGGRGAGLRGHLRRVGWQPDHQATT